jgi:uncharacterized protein (TIGR03437 family)
VRRIFSLTGRSLTGRGAVLLLVLATAGFAYVRQTTGATPLVRTDSAGIQFSLNSLVVAGVQSSASGSAVTVIAGDSNPQAAIHAALATWNAAGGNLSFKALQSTSATINGGDNQMTIAIGSSQSDISFVGQALAVTIDTFNPATGVIVDSDIIINPANCFTTTGVSSACTGGTAYDFQATMTHEFGHALGLNHTGLLGAGMFQFNTLTERSLSSDELAFVNTVYPAATPAALGTINGAITTGGGSAEPFALITMVDSAPAGQPSGGSYSALADANGNYSLKVPPGSYQLYAEPLNGVVQPGNLYLTLAQANQVQQFMATRFSGSVNVSANTISTANINVPGGASAIPVPYLSSTSLNGTTSVLFYQGGPTFLPSGGSVDLLFGGTGFDGTLTDANFAILGDGVSLHAGSVRLDPGGATVGPYKILRVTLDIAAQQGLSLASIFVTKGANTLSLSGTLVIGPPKPTTTSASVVNSASGLGNGGGNGAVSPGGLYTVYDIPNNPNLGPNVFTNNGGYDPYGFLAPLLGGVSVTFDGIPAPIFFVNGSQINLQVPFEVAGKSSTKVVVNYLGSVSTAVNVPVMNEQPALISVDSSGKGPVAAVNQDGTLNSAAHPAPRGTVVTIYGTAVGQQPGYTVFPTGQGAPAVPSGFTGNYTYSIGGSTPAPANYVGPTPTAVGLAQFNLVVPNSSAGGLVSVSVTSPNGIGSQPGTSIYVQASSPNVANAAGSIDGLYPASGAAAAQNGGKSTSAPVSFSALLTAGTFTAAFDILPNASPFTVVASCPAGSATIQINPAQNTWQANYIVPTQAARAGDFSGDGFTVLNYLANGLPFPNNIVPLSQLDQMASSALNLLPPPNVAGPNGPNGTLSASGTLPAGGHFTIGAGTNPIPNFGGFINLSARGPQSSKFSLKIDGQLVASTDVPFTTD